MLLIHNVKARNSGRTGAEGPRRKFTILTLITTVLQRILISRSPLVDRILFVGFEIVTLLSIVILFGVSVFFNARSTLVKTMYPPVII